MRSTNLLLRLYFEESRVQGVCVVRRWLSEASSIDLTLIDGATKERLPAEITGSRLAKPFNLLEGVVVFRDPLDASRRTEVDFRYRPSFGSGLWRTLDVPPNLAATDAGVDPETFQFFLSLIGFEKPAIARGANQAAVFEMLCCSVTSEPTIEKTVTGCLSRFCHELLSTDFWGYADVIPFRDLSPEQEWQVARTDVLWADLAITADAEHQYLLRTTNARPEVPFPDIGVREGAVTVARLYPGGGWVERP